MLKRLSLLIGGVILGLGAGEAGLRATYSTLPSMAPIAEGGYKLQPFVWPDGHPGSPSNPNEICDLLPTFQRGQQRHGHTTGAINQGEGPPLRLTIAGDSIAHGAGLRFPESYGHKLADAIAKAENRSVEILNTASPGAGFCDILQTNLVALDTHPTPDLIVIELFADDLEERAALMIGDELVLLPDRVDSPLGRALVSRSYIANLAWLAIAPTFHQMPQRMILPEQQRFFQAALRGLKERYEAAGAGVLIMLLPPSGLPHCPEDTHPYSRCRWLKEDLNTMARLMDQGDIPYLDLRTLWDNRPISLIDVEREALNSGRMDLGIHPDSEGHTYLAEALLEPALKALREAHRRQSPLNTMASATP